MVITISPGDHIKPLRRRNEPSRDGPGRALSQPSTLPVQGQGHRVLFKWAWWRVQKIQNMLQGYKQHPKSTLVPRPLLGWFILFTDVSCCCLFFSLHKEMIHCSEPIQTEN